MEEWKDIKDYEGLYQVSSEGNVRSLDRFVETSTGIRHYKEKILKTYLAGTDKDYHYIKLHKNGTQTPFEIHRLVAQAFIPNPENKPQVDHIRGNKNDNSVKSLRWATQPENMNNENTKQYNNLKLSKQVYQYSLDNKLLNVWPSLNEVVRNGFDKRAIQRCCNGERKTHKGSQWSFTPL